jgi:hypothetical protein
MTGLTLILMCFIYFICIGLDIAMFFLQIRLILIWRNIAWLVPFDNTGKSLVDAVSNKISVYFKTQKQLTEKGKLIIALIAFAIIRVILGTILKAIY